LAKSWISALSGKNEQIRHSGRGAGRSHAAKAVNAVVLHPAHSAYKK
jgi:hypothetical protein